MSTERVPLEVKERGPELRGSRPISRLRREGVIPAVLYGKGHTRAIMVGERELRTALSGPFGLNAIFDIVIEGQKTPHHAVAKELQRHPVRGTLTHIDFHEVRLDRLIHASIAVHLVGEAPGAKQGGVLQQVTRDIRIEALPTRIPENLEVDISSLEVGVTLRLADIQELEGITFLDPPETILATCTIPRGLTAGGEELEEEAGEDGSGVEAEADASEESTSEE